jgi:preprotein translocase subunit SecG
MFKKFITVMLCFTLCLSTLDAKPSSGGGSSSSSRSSGSGFSGSRSAPSGMTTKQQAVPTPVHTQQSKPTATKSNVDNKVNKMVKVGNTNVPKEKAISDFKAKHASSYTSTYKSQPSSRPSHIPSSYSSGGHTYNINYNSGHGGYGYYGPSGAWIMYDAMRDVAMMSILMNNHGYRDVVVTNGGGIVSDGYPAQTVVVQRHSTFSGYFTGIIIILFAIVMLIFVVRMER